MDDQPFLGSLAMARGAVTRNQLRRHCRRLFHDVYIKKTAPDTASTRLKAALLWAGPQAALCGTSAAAVYGTKWLDPAAAVELIRYDRRSPAGIVVRSYTLEPGDVRAFRGLQVTTPLRTAFDIGRTRSRERAVPILDALTGATGLTPADVSAFAAARPGVPGVRRLRRTLELVDAGAESPQETRVRLLLVAAGLPRPETQIKFFDEYGEAYIRVDMGWRHWKVAVEYDGIQHWENARQRSWDIERIAILDSMGWIVIRVSAAMVKTPAVFLGRVAAALRGRGAPI